MGNPSSVLKFSIIAFSKIDTPGFGDVVDNTNCWQPITGEQSQVGNQSQLRSPFRLLGGTVLSIPGRRNEVREII